MSIRKKTKHIVWATTITLFLVLTIIHLSTFNLAFRQLQKDQLNMYKAKVHSIIEQQSNELSNLHHQIIKLGHSYYLNKSTHYTLKDINIFGLYLFREEGHVLKKSFKTKQLQESEVAYIHNIINHNLSIYGRSNMTGIIQVNRHVYIIDATKINHHSFDFSILIRRLSHKTVLNHQSHPSFRVKFVPKVTMKQKHSSKYKLLKKFHKIISPPIYSSSRFIIASDFLDKPIYWKIIYKPEVINTAKTQTIFELTIIILLLVMFSYTIISTFEKRINKPLSALVKQIDDMSDLDTLDPISHHDGPQELVILSNKLNQLFNEYNAQQLHFHQNNDKLSQALIQSKLNEKQIASFFSNMSHDIRTPLNAIIGFSELISENLCDENEKKEYAGIVLDNGIKLIEYIESIIELSTLINNTLTPNKKSISINELTRNLQIKILDQKQKLHKNELQIKFKHGYNHENNYLYTDEILLIRCITNLTSNSFKFTEEGRINIETKQSNNNFIFIVTDTGKGIDDVFLKYLGKEFLQEEDTYTKSVEGTGIGLSISYRIARILGGKIEINSIKGKGTEAIVSIPLSL
ncbi:HAMP domain-containing sensor histidine kinase [Prolixibacteraceae bacterium]|nr:HAMP domain-containing sensor histidine kinase [Prolixibacteraceae bacterium]